MDKKSKNSFASSDKGTRYPALRLVNKSPETAAMISKLVQPRLRPTTDMSDGGSRTINQGQIQSISQEVQNRIRDNQNIIQLFPDIELAIQILVSSILSPKDMVQTTLNYKTDETRLPPDLQSSIVGVIKEHFETHYKVKDELSQILRELLFETGSHVKLVLPEAAVDEIINTNAPNAGNGTFKLSTESLNQIWNHETKSIRSLGILGSPDTSAQINKLSFEDMFNPQILNNYRSYPVEEKISLEGLLEVTDNFSILKLPKILDKVRKQRIKDLTTPYSNLATESKLTDSEFKSVAYKDSQNNPKNFLKFPGHTELKRKSVGRPLVMRIPSESVIPVYTPGDETNHIGYFVPVDEEGHFLSIKNAKSLLGQANNMVVQADNNSQATQTSVTSLLLMKAKNNLKGMNQKVTLDQMAEIYSAIVEKDLVNRLNNGLYGTSAGIAKNEQIYRVMLARSMASMLTRLVYIPAELVTYFAFKFHENGVGKSLMDDIKVLCSIRGMILFSKVHAQIKSAIGVTEVNITMDPNDPDPVKTIETATHEIARSRQQYMPLGTNNTTDLMDWINRAGFELHWEGHPALPDTKFSFDPKNLTRDVNDSDLEEELRKQTFMTFGLSPEIVDNGNAAEFATTVVANNILFSKRIIKDQEKFSVLLSDYMRKLALADAIFMADIKTAINEKIGIVENILTDEEKELYATDPKSVIKDIIEEVLSSIRVELPKPELTTLKSQAEAFGIYEEAVDKALGYWLSSEMITSEFVGEIADKMDPLKAVLKAHFLRAWMSNNGYLTELADITMLIDDGKPALDIYEVNKNHMQGLITNALKLIKSLIPMKTASDKDLQNLTGEEGEGDSGGGESSDTGSEEPSSEGGEESGGEEGGGESGTPDEMPDFGAGF